MCPFRALDPDSDVRHGDVSRHVALTPSAVNRAVAGRVPTVELHLVYCARTGHLLPLSGSLHRTSTRIGPSSSRALGCALLLHGLPLIAWFSKVQRARCLSPRRNRRALRCNSRRQGRRVRYRELLFDLGAAPQNPTSHLLRLYKSCVDLSYDPVSCKKTKHILRPAEGRRNPIAFAYALPVTTDLAHVCADLRSRLREGTTICALARDASLGLNKSSSVMLPAIALAALASRSTSSIIVER